jgi:hypothetical protein
MLLVQNLHKIGAGEAYPIRTISSPVPHATIFPPAASIRKNGICAFFYLYYVNLI